MFDGCRRDIAVFQGPEGVLPFLRIGQRTHRGRRRIEQVYDPPAFANRVSLIDVFKVDFSEKTSQKVGPLLRIVL